uniref:phosphoserine transaminase n=1 Tax=Trichogramma kaykai TaxID=54128 RepID=A0ABD2VVN9_9HYME
MNGKKNERAINFGAGPGQLPLEVLEEVQAELLAYKNAKVSILEISHRSGDFKKVIESAQARLTQILNIPDNYKVLFMQGGGTGLFSAVPLNMMTTGTADYIVTGSCEFLIDPLSKFCGNFDRTYFQVLGHRKRQKKQQNTVKSIWSYQKLANTQRFLTDQTGISIQMRRIEFHDIPETNGVPLVADMSSNFVSKPIDVSKFGLIFAGAQKNVGPSGVTIVIIRKDFIGTAMKICPSILDFAVVAEGNSIHNTPPVFQIYFVGLVFEWILKNGGVEGMEELARQKSQMIYDIIEKSNGFYSCPIKENCRSRMNIPFRIKNDEKLENDFVSGAAALNMLQLKGHRSVGGIRVSLYNAVTLDQVKQLSNYMIKFYEQHKN